MSNVNIDLRILSYCLETQKSILISKVIVSNGCIDRTIQAYRLTSWAWELGVGSCELGVVRKPLAGSSRHLSQKRNLSFFSSDGFLPFKEEPGISLSGRTTDIVSLVSFDDLEVLSQNASIPCLAARSAQVGGHL